MQLNTLLRLRRLIRCRAARTLAGLALAVAGNVAAAADALPPAVLAALRSSGLPLASFGIYARPVDGLVPSLTLNDAQPFLLASTTKVVTSLAALQLLGPAYRWRTQAYATAPVVGGRTAGDLVIVGGSAGLTPAELGRWFRQMQAEGLAQVGGRIVLDGFALLYQQHPSQAATSAAEAVPGPLPPALLDPRTYNAGKAVVTVQPGPGGKAVVALKPKPAGVTIVNDIEMGGGNCAARVRWSGDGSGVGSGAASQLVVSGRWDLSCGRQEVAFVNLPQVALAARSPLVPVPRTAPPALTGGGRATAAATTAAPAPAPKAAPTVSVPTLVASIWAQAGGRVAGGVVEADRRTQPAARPAWSSQITTSLPAVVREMNKTSNNVAAKNLLLALAPPGSGAPGATPLRAAQERVAAWLRTQGFDAGDLRIDEGSGQSRAERGTPRAMVQLLDNAWHSRGSGEFVDSLPIAGFDGTLANRMKRGAATGHAFLKTGTLSDTRALAGYVMAASGKIYAVALMATHADAARATPALDATIEWLARNG